MFNNADELNKLVVTKLIIEYSIAYSTQFNNNFAGH